MRVVAKPLFLMLIAFACGLALPSAATPQDALPEKPLPVAPVPEDRRADRSCAYVAALSAYVAQHGPFERLDICPNIIFSPRDPAAQGPAQDRGAVRLRGATYYIETETILLPATAYLHSVTGMALLLHELVHFYQYAHGHHKAVECKEALEPQAFEMQALFLRQNGYEPDAKKVEQRGLLRGICPSRRSSLN